jgi:nucleoid-associated protein YgaU
MANLAGLASIVSELRVERTNLANQLKHIDAVLSVLGKLNGVSSRGKPRRIMPAAARRKISVAQKARWAKVKGQVQKPERTISAAGRKRIAAAQRARWAKVKTAKKWHPNPTDSRTIEQRLRYNLAAGLRTYGWTEPESIGSRAKVISEGRLRTAAPVHAKVDLQHA